MIRMILAAAAALALVSAAPAFACPDCKDCPHHKDKVAQSDQAGKKADDKADKDKKAVDCPCHKGETGPCKCGDKCQCAAKKTEKKADDKKA